LVVCPPCHSPPVCCRGVKMGNCTGGGEVPATPEEREREKAITKMLKEDKSRIQKEVRFLLLGAGQSGKSTLAKQMKLIHLGGFSGEERDSFLEIVWANIRASVRALLLAANLESLTLSPASQEVVKKGWYRQDQGPITPKIAEDIKILWADETIQKVFREELSTAVESTEYFFSHLDRISASDYSPSIEDVLRARVKTTGVGEIQFQIADTIFRMVDVGGQRSERRKWIHCFENITAVIFFIAINEYNMRLEEDSTVNRLSEALALFEEIVNSEWFKESAFIVFLNKNDLFKKKIETVDMKCLFPNYKGGCNYDKAIKYLTSKVNGIVKEPRDNFYIHPTVATDTKNVELVFGTVRKALLTSMVNDTGLPTM